LKNMFFLFVVLAASFFPVSLSVCSGEMERSFSNPRLVTEPGPGHENRARIDKARALMSQKRYEAALTVLERVIAELEAKPAGVYVSSATREEARRYAEEIGNPDVIWLDWSYRQAYFLKAFIATELNDHEKALRLLAKVKELSPGDPNAWCETGNIFNLTGRPEEALAQYRRAYSLSKDDVNRTDYAALALRGMGFAYIELGELEKAGDAYRESLKLNPGNRIAIKELIYLDRLRRRR